MSLLQDIQKHKEKILTLAKQNGCQDVRIFGSAIRGEEHPQSDIDILVNIKKGYSLLDMIGFQIELQKLFNKKVEVIPEKALHWYIKKDVLNEAKPI